MVTLEARSVTSYHFALDSSPARMARLKYFKYAEREIPLLLRACFNQRENYVVGYSGVRNTLRHVISEVAPYLVMTINCTH